MLDLYIEAAIIWSKPSAYVVHFGLRITCSQPFVATYPVREIIGLHFFQIGCRGSHGASFRLQYIRTSWHAI